MDSFFFFLQGEIHNKMVIQAKVFQTDILFSSREWIRSPFSYERKNSFLHPLQDIIFCLILELIISNSTFIEEVIRS